MFCTLLPSLVGCKTSIVRLCMDTKLFNFIAKISFCTYLLHYAIIGVWVNSRTYSKYYTNLTVFFEYCGILVVSLLCGLVMTFLIEIPFSKLQKTLISYIK